MLPAGVLVYFHNHSTQGPPVVHPADSNRHNRWRFRASGVPITDSSYLSTLEPRKAEGFYRLRKHFHPDAGRVVAANTLVQLGYNRAGEPIIFFPNRSDDTNALVFPTEGMRIPVAVYELLEPLDLRGPVHPTPVH